MNFNKATDIILADSAGRALDSIISKYKWLQDVGYTTYTKLIESCVKPILCYCSLTWGYKRYPKLCEIQHRAMRVFLGVHRVTAIASMHGDMGWLGVRSWQWIHMVRFWNRMQCMEPTRLTKYVFQWDRNQSGNRCSTGIKTIFDAIGLKSVYTNNSMCNENLLLEKSICTRTRNGRMKLPISLN